MKTIIPTLAIIASTCLGAQPATAPAPIPLEPAEPQAAVAGAPAAGHQEAADIKDEVIEEEGTARAARARSRAMRDANRAIQQANKVREQAMRDAEKSMQMAQSALPGQDNEAGESAMLFADADAGPIFMDQKLLSLSSRNSSQPLIVRTGDLDAATLSNIQEDLAVMSRILTKTIEREFGREARDSAMGIVLSTLPGSRRPHSIYLEGYGALFLVSVKFPLVPPPAKEEEKAEKSADSTWEQTKEELSAQRSGTTVRNVQIWNVNTGDPTAEYSAEQVDNLKKELLEALRNGSNIRNLKPDESITVAVVGSRSGPTTAKAKKSGKSTGTSKNKGDFSFSTADGARTTARETMLTLRVKKADIDAFSKGTIAFDEFKKRASVSAY